MESTEKANEEFNGLMTDEQREALEVVTVKGEDVLPLPLDRGYAWVVTFACMMNSCIVDGIANSFGYLLGDFCDYFSADKASVTLIGSLLCGVYLLTGPIAGALVNKFGCRPVCMAGALLAAAAFVLSSFAPSLTALTISYGVIGGIGFGLIYLPSMVCVNFYFEEYRALAMGLAVCGTGIGTMVMGPLTRALAESLGWRNCLLILAGVVLNAAVFGALMRPNEPQPEPAQKRRRRMSRVGRGRRPDDTDEAAACRELFASTLSVRKRSTTEVASVGKALQSLPSLVDHRTKIPAGSASNRCRVAKAARARQFDVKAVCDDPIATAAIEDLKRPLYRKDIFYAGSVASLASARIRSRSTVTPSQLFLSMTRIPGETTHYGSRKNTFELSKEQDTEMDEDSKTCLPKPIRDAFIMMTDMSLMKDTSYLIVWLGNLTAMLAFYIPLFFVSDFAREAGVSDGQSKYLNTAFGSANTLSRILVGWAAGNPKVSPLLVNNVSLFLSAALALALNYSTSFPLLIATYTALGITLAPFITLTSEILCLLVGLDNLTSAFGLITLARGISTCVGSPLAASLYSPSTKYLLPFAVGGGLFALSSVIFSILLLPRFSQRQDANRSELQETMRSVQNLHASFLLVEGTQLVTSNSVNLDLIASDIPASDAKAHGNGDLPQSMPPPNDLLEATV